MAKPGKTFPCGQACAGCEEPRHHHGSCPADCCDHGEEEEERNWFTLFRIVLALLFLLGGLFLAPLLQKLFPNTPVGSLRLPFYAVAYLVVGGDIVWKALRNILHGRIFDENFLMALASVGAFCVGEAVEGVAVVGLYQLGEFLQDLAVGRSRDSITALMDLRPDSARRLVGEKTELCPPGEIAVGELIVVHPGERVPLDGVVYRGTATLDTAALTGESLPREVGEGEEVLSGSINLREVLILRVSRIFRDSTVSRILALTRSTEKKAETERFITRFARIYTPIVVAAAVLTAVLPPLFLGWDTFSVWLYRALIFLVVSCPCALVISIPLGFFSGIGAASRNGILVKGSRALEALGQITALALDKTGTLTEGTFAVDALLPADGVPEDKLLQKAALAECRSSHPLARAVCTYTNRSVDETLLADTTEVAGKGIIATLRDGRRLLAGSRKLLEENRVAVPAALPGKTAVLFAEDGRYLGAILFADRLKPSAAKALEALREMGVSDFTLLTGDAPEAAAAAAEAAGIARWEANLLPQEKTEAVDRIGTEHTGVLAFIGDGINDAPVIARADLGIAMGGIGSDAAIEAADVVLMTDDLTKLPLAVRIARKTKRIVTQNIVFALTVKIAILLLSLFGLSSMWLALFADVGVALLAVFNALRALRSN